MDVIIALPIAVLMYGAIPLYAVWQVQVLFRRRGWPLALSLLPIPLMAHVGLLTLDAWRQDSTLWPLLLILTVPIAVLWLWAIGRLSGNRETAALA